VPQRFHVALVALLAAPLAASAAGLGRLALFSMVGEPLNAEIEIVSVLPNERDSLAAKLAPAEVYERAHVAPIPSPEAVRVAIERKSDGREVVKVSSTAPLDKPLVNLLVELSWTGGGVIRQYSFLLDAVDRKAPPLASTPPPIEPWRAPSAAAERPAPLPEPAPAAAPARPAEPLAAAKPAAPPRAPEATREAARAPSPAAAAPGTYAVRSGDTLRKIAQELRPEGVSTEQMMAAIYRANEDAFIGGNMNRLRGGRTLKIPDRDAAAAVTMEAARELIAAQSAQPEARGRPGATAPPGPSGDDVTALDRAIAESRDRAAELEKTLAELKRLIEGQDRQIEELQRQLGGKAPAKAGAPGQPAGKTP
jgi:pilus assembly protein FimV